MSVRCRVVSQAPYGTASGEQLAFYASGRCLDQGRYTLPAMREEEIRGGGLRRTTMGESQTSQKNNNSEDELEML